MELKKEVTVLGSMLVRTDALHHWAELTCPVPTAVPTVLLD